MTKPPLVGLFTNPDKKLTFNFEGRTIEALEGQSIGAALYAAGQRIFTRSFKYHRPRGLFCMTGDCPNCMMNVDGRPNVRTCVEPAKQGQVVTHQNAWPSLEFDVLNIFDKLSRFLPVGFYYKKFHKPRWLWPIFEKLVRRVAGLGKIDANVTPPDDAEVEHIHVEVCVVGGGPAGLSAAAAAAQAGAQVLLIDRQPRLGGHLLYAAEGTERLTPLLVAVERESRIQACCDTHVFGLYEGNLLAAYQGSRLLKIRARQIIVCTGGREQPFLFDRNDVPGVMLGDAVLRLARLHGVLAGKRAVVLTDNDRGSELATQLTGLGIEVAALVDYRPRPKTRTKTPPWPTYYSACVALSVGKRNIEKILISDASDKERNPLLKDIPEVSCDLLCLSSQLSPANELLRQGGMRFQHHWFSAVPSTSVSGLAAAGAAAGILELERQIADGRACGTESARVLGYSVDAWEAEARSIESREPTDRHFSSGYGKSFVCLCEDVTNRDLRQAIGEGFEDIETLKRYSTANMGPCQGKMCGRNIMAICAWTKPNGILDIKATTSRPPVEPVELGILAADRHHHPIRRTPIHHWHGEHGAHWMDAGLWKRPEHYGNPLAEVDAVRNRVGLIDVSTLGKIEVIGPDAAELLERIYLNRWTDLKVGRARYGAMCTEDGILFDDGVGARLAADRFYITATTGNADAVVQWLELWRATWRLNCHVVNRTSAIAAMNLVGPNARQVLSKLTALDVSAAAFPYMAFREAEVAGVSCRLLRIGFVGESGYEIHCLSSHALHVWEALVRAGEAFGLEPFGVEAQRVLRLEKGHLIVSVDTDALSNPLDAGLEWMIAFDKPMFHGRENLLRLRAMAPRQKLVGFFMMERERVPLEGCQVVEKGRPVGRITSARYSPTLNRSIGLAWVPSEKATPGERFHIRWNEADVPAVVAPLPFYDPQGKRLKN